MSKEKKLIPRLRFPEFDNKGQWEKKELSQLGSLINGLTYSPEDVREKGLLVLRSSNIQNGIIDFNDCVFVRPDINGANLSEPNDILVCVRNGSKRLIGKNALIPKGIPLATHGTFMTVFRAEYPEFVFQLFQSEAYKKQVKADLGATINSINGKNFLKYEFLVPPNPKEQQKITSCLSSLDEMIVAHIDKLEALKDHKKGLMQNLFPQEGKKVPNYRFPEFEGDGVWKKSTLGNYFKNLSTGMTPSRKKPEYFTGNIPWITSGELDYNLITKTKEYITKEAVTNTNLKIYKPGTLFIAITGLEAPGTRGRCAINGIEATTNQSCMAFEEVPEFDNLFLFYWYMRFSEKLYSLSQGTKQQSFNNNIVERIEIIHPKPKEQQKIASCLSDLDESITAQAEKIEQLQEHKKGLMQGLFPKIDS